MSKGKLTDDERTDEQLTTGHSPPNLADGDTVTAYIAPEEIVHVAGHKTRQVRVETSERECLMFECQDCDLCSNNVTRFADDPCSRLVLDYDKVSTVLASKYRDDTLAALTGGAKTPARIAAETGHEITHVSRALTELRDIELVELLTSEQTQKGRLYAMTDEGAAVADYIDAREESAHV